MKGKMLKAGLLLLTLAVLAVLAACGNGNKTDTAAGTDTASASPSASAPASATAKAADSSAGGNATAAPTKQPVTLKIWMTIGNKGVNGVHDDPIMQELAKETGVTLDFSFFDTPDAYNAKLASGDLPDIIIARSTEVPALMQGGNMIDMAPLLADDGQSILEETPDKVKFAEKFMSNDTGKLYFLPTEDEEGAHLPIKSFNNGPGTGIGLFLNWSVYKQIGYPEMKNDLFGIIPIVKQMQAAHPKTDDGKKVYGFSPFFADWDLWNFTILTEAAQNVDGEQAKFVDIPFDGGPITSQIEDKNSTLWQGAKFWYEANQAGIVDPDSFTQKYGQYYDKMTAGRVLATETRWAGNSAYEAIALPSNITKWSSGWYKPYADRWFEGITTKSKYPKRAMDLINFINSSAGMRLLLNGVEGTNWSLEDGVPRLTPDTLKIVTNGTAEQKQQLGVNAYSGLVGRSVNMWDSENNAYMNYMWNEPFDSQLANDPLAQDYVQHYNVSYPDELFQKTLPDTLYTADGTFLNMVQPTPDDIKQIDDKLDTYMQGQLLKAVMAKSDDEFNKIQDTTIAQAQAMGADKAFQWHKDNYDSARTEVKDFTDSLGK